MIRVMDENPNLSDFGFGVFDARLKSPSQRAAELAENRNKLLETRSLEQFGKARDWLAGKPRTIRVNPSAGSSYGLKHLAEHDIGYVTNGVFIAAALAEGFKLEVPRGSPNAWFNIGKRAITEARSAARRANRPPCL